LINILGSVPPAVEVAEVIAILSNAKPALQSRRRYAPPLPELPQVHLPLLVVRLVGSEWTQPEND